MFSSVSHTPRVKGVAKPLGMKRPGGGVNPIEVVDTKEPPEEMNPARYRPMKGPAMMSQEFSKLLASGLFHLLINGIY